MAKVYCTINPAIKRWIPYIRATVLKLQTHGIDDAHPTFELQLTFLPWPIGLLFLD
jgi:hypothetical protein